VSQHDFEIANQGFPSFRSDLNSGLQALASNSAGATEPSTTYAYQMWYDETTDLLKMRNGDDDAWITLAAFDQTNDEWEVRSAVIQAIDSAGIALKTDDGTTRFSISDAGVVSFENYAFPSADGTAGQVLSTDGSGTLTFEDAGAGDKIEEGNSSVEVVDTGTGHVAVTTDGSERVRVDSSGNVGIGTSSPNQTLELFKAGGVRLRLSETASRYGEIAGFANGAANGSSLQFYTIEAGTSTLTERMRLGSAGEFKMDSGYGSVATAYGCRAWVNFDGTGTVSIRDDGNVSSITDNSTGDFTINFSTAMPDANYAAVASGRNNEGYSTGYIAQQFSTSVRVGVHTNGGLVDVTHNSIAIIR